LGYCAHARRREAKGPTAAVRPTSASLRRGNRTDASRSVTRCSTGCAAARLPGGSTSLGFGWWLRIVSLERRYQRSEYTEVGVDRRYSVGCVMLPVCLLGIWAAGCEQLLLYQ
jgi:hypothetical protein